MSDIGIDHDEEMAPAEVLLELPPRQLTQAELEMILAPEAEGVSSHGLKDEEVEG